MLTVVKGAGINRQSPAEPRTDTRQSQSQSHSPEKRSMPVKPKESIHPPIIPPPLEVYDEWAAVLRHQDEVSLAAEERERQLQKERQRLYSQQLAAQKAELDSRMRRNTEVGSVEDREAVQLQTDFVKQKAELEKLQSAEKRAKAESIMQENLVEKRRATMAVKELEKQDNMMVLEQIKRINEEGEQKVRDEKDVKVRVVNALRESYEIQEEMKRRQRMQTKELDKVFLKKEEELSQENERNRQRVPFRVNQRGIVLRCAKGEAANDEREGTAVPGLRAGEARGPAEAGRDDPAQVHQRESQEGRNRGYPRPRDQVPRKDCEA